MRFDAKWMDGCRSRCRSTGKGTINTKDVQTSLLRIMEDSDFSLKNSNGNNNTRNSNNSGNSGSFLDRIREQQQQQADRSSSSSFSFQRMDPSFLPTKHIMFVFTGAFNHLNSYLAKKHGGLLSEDSRNASFLHLATTEDFVKCGFEPEFMGRIGKRVSLSQLSENEMIEILTKTKGNILERQKFDLKQYDIDLEFAECAVEEIAKMALKSEGGGARGLVGVVERVLRDYKFELPGLGINTLKVDRDMVRNPDEKLSKLLQNKEETKWVT